ncbi:MULTISPECIES: hypothetical protein [Clostridium]|uniref:hypothetical protein n=1 Tax=Clostridium TaxID=1485 RepID=UPI0001663C4E|nr:MULTISPECIES: hypothetical protein [Clostridium]EDS76887.1 hypothetical protein CBC_1027 [Clostridium botulinum C str. Eklund]
MVTLIISILIGITGYFIGGAIGGEFVAVILGVAGFFALPFNMLEKLYAKFYKDNKDI